MYNPQVEPNVTDTRGVLAQKLAKRKIGQLQEQATPDQPAVQPVAPQEPVAAPMPAPAPPAQTTVAPAITPAERLKKIAISRRSIGI